MTGISATGGAGPALPSWHEEKISRWWRKARLDHASARGMRKKFRAGGARPVSITPAWNSRLPIRFGGLGSQIGLLK
jgi:hypothetical protein